MKVELGEAVAVLGEKVRESVGRIADSTELPPGLRAEAPLWAAGVASNLAAAAAAKASGDQEAYDRATREVRLFGEAAKAVATGELMLGMAAAEAEARRRLDEAIQFGVGLGLKLLAAAL